MSIEFSYVILKALQRTFYIKNLINGEVFAVSQTNLFVHYCSHKFEARCVRPTSNFFLPTVEEIGLGLDLVIIAKRTHPFPSRTRKLSSLALMILGGQLPGKVGRRRVNPPGQIDYIINYSEVAQWWSNRLLTGRSWVRAPPSEPYLAEVAESADAQDLKSCGPQNRTGSSPVFGTNIIFAG